MQQSHERNINLSLSKSDDYDKIALIAKALSSKERIIILNLLTNNSMSIVEIANKLNLAVSSTAFHIKALEAAGLILTHSQAGIRGSMRVSISCVQLISILCEVATKDTNKQTLKVDMPIGNFHDCNITPTCGMADENSIISVYDNPGAFYSPQRSCAQLIWFNKGFLEYKFPNYMLKFNKVNDISFQFEVCSEAPGFRDDWPSDITIIINNKEIATYTSPGDFGTRLGKLTPKHWGYGLTQFGLLKTFSVRANGCYIDEALINNNIKVDDLNLTDNDYISFKICIKDDAKHIGGINLFGEKFGDFEQGIVMRVNYSPLK